MSESLLSNLLTKNQETLLSEWNEQLAKASDSGRGLISNRELQEQTRDFLNALEKAIPHGATFDAKQAHWTEMKELLMDISKQRVAQGFSSSETATFILSAKAPLFKTLKKELIGDPDNLAEAIWQTTELIDSLGLFTVKMYQQTREDLIQRQQNELLELSTPVVKLWDGILALPMIGTLDSARTQIVMESLLQRIVETGASYAIIDITGVLTVDTLVAQHLLKTVTAIRLMGAEAIISGIRPQIAQTIVHLGVDLGSVITKATLADALLVALTETGHKFSKKD